VILTEFQVTGIVWKTGSSGDATATGVVSPYFSNIDLGDQKIVFFREGINFSDAAPCLFPYYLDIFCFQGWPVLYRQRKAGGDFIVSI